MDTTEKCFLWLVCSQHINFFKETKVVTLRIFWQQFIVSTNSGHFIYIYIHTHTHTHTHFCVILEDELSVCSRTGDRWWFNFQNRKSFSWTCVYRINCLDTFRLSFPCLSWFFWFGKSYNASNLLLRVAVLTASKSTWTKQLIYHILEKYLRESRGSVLAFGTQVRGFKPDRSRWIFQGEKILSKLSFGGEVMTSVSCRRFTACKRSLNFTWKSGILSQNSSVVSRTCSSTSGC